MKDYDGKVSVHGVGVKYKKLTTPENLPNKLRDFIDGGIKNGLGSYLRTLDERMSEEYKKDYDYTYRDDVIHLSEVYKCLLSSYFNRELPDWLEQFPSEVWKKNYNMKKGSILNAVITSLFPTSEKSVSYPLHPTTGRDASLTGRLDFATDGIVYELKRLSDYSSSKVKKEGPYPWHIQQVLFYRRCRSYRKARILLWFSNEIQLYEIGLENQDKVMEELVSRGEKLHKHIVEGEPPEPESGYAWSCNICEFGKRICGKNALCNGKEILVGT